VELMEAVAVDWNCSNRECARANQKFKSFLLSVVASGGLILNACAPSDEDGSNLSYAHLPPQSMAPSPLARLAAIENGLSRNFSNLEVCVERPRNEQMSTSSLVLETKLAMAAWLQAAGRGRHVWNDLVSVTVNNHCDHFDERYAIVIAIDDPPTIESTGSGDLEFRSPQMRCWTERGINRCQRDGLVRGIGWPGAMRTYRRGSTLAAFEQVRPGFAVLNPHLKWLSIDSDLDANTELAHETREKLKRDYRQLLRQESPGFDELVAYNQALAEVEVISVGDLGFQSSFIEQVRFSQQPQPVAYQYQSAAYHVLLHEVGHVFGMHHADNPVGHLITGHVGEGVQNDAGQWVTEVSTMAYGLDYFFLTEDDRAGVKNAETMFQTYIRQQTGVGE